MSSTENMVTMELPVDLYKAIEQLKEMFKEVTQNDEVSDIDVVATLVAGFMDGVKKEQGGCGWNCGCWSSENGGCSGHCGCC